MSTDSLVKIRPAISKVWTITKEFVESTAARPLVANPVVNKIECSVPVFTDFMVTKMKELRNKLLPKEEKYLQRQLEIVKQKLAEIDTKKKC